jgi:flagellar biosynthesis/type III secretory pathway protein FliH
MTFIGVGSLSNAKGVTMTMEERVNQVERFLDKIPWTSFSHGALVSAFEKAEQEAYQRGYEKGEKKVTTTAHTMKSKYHRVVSAMPKATLTRGGKR